MKKPLKPLCQVPDNEKIVGAGGKKEHLNPNSRPLVLVIASPGSGRPGTGKKDKGTPNPLFSFIKS